MYVSLLEQCPIAKYKSANTHGRARRENAYADLEGVGAAAIAAYKANHFAHFLTTIRKTTPPFNDQQRFR